MSVISIINIKGGVGKTQSCVNLAGAFALMKKKVLLIDNDPQSNLTQILDVDASGYNMYDLYTNSKVGIDDCIVSYNKYIDVIPNTITSSILEKHLNNRMFGETVLKNKLSDDIKKKYDIILIDNSPFLGMLSTNALCSCDYYLEVIDNSVMSLQGLNMVHTLIKDIKDNALNLNLKLLGILRSRFEKRTVFSREFGEVLEGAYDNELFNTIIFDSVKYKEATANNLLIQDHNTKFAKPYDDLAKEILNRIGE